MNSEVTVRTLSVRRDEPKEIKSLRDLVETSAELYGDKILYIYKRGEARYSFSYNDYRRDLYRLGEGMSRIGLMGRRELPGVYDGIYRGGQRRRRYRSSRP